MKTTLIIIFIIFAIIILIVIKFKKQIREYLDLRHRKKELEEQYMAEDKAKYLEEQANKSDELYKILQRQEKATKRINVVDEFRNKQKTKGKGFINTLDKISKFAEKLPMAQKPKGKPKDMFDPGMFKGLDAYKKPKRKKGRSQFEILPPKFLIILFGLILLGNMLVMCIGGG